ncbi:putative phospholipid-transporting ATPase IF [Chionoecetes opilio]|uniref:Putative phospholipid-transporting ATPase IF n=1 Tax=Chionoecetes opilio TaxID=41210 RepID=A0A8J5CEI2_CHIOP|nr:putative phospholipid-transporting ATPase IF [Chionoecetes opilio]
MGRPRLGVGVTSDNGASKAGCGRDCGRDVNPRLGVGVTSGDPRLGVGVTVGVTSRDPRLGVGVTVGLTSGDPRLGVGVTVGVTSGGPRLGVDVTVGVTSGDPRLGVGVTVGVTSGDPRLGVGGSQRQPVTSRTVLVNGRPPEEATTPLAIPRYGNNQIKTSKYTWFNFIPKNLFEQFRRIANFYFLVVSVIQLTIESPVSPMTSILPLVIVVSVTAVKQAYEDWLRHTEDNKINNVSATVLRQGKATEVRNQDIMVGDVVKVADEEGFPCDLLLLLSSNPEAKCEVTTANLDGETNLKTFVCPGETEHLQTPEDLWNMTAVVECQLPHANLYDFKGALQVFRGNSHAAKTPLATENLLLRGARLRNTPWVYGE